MMKIVYLIAFLLLLQLIVKANFSRKFEEEMLEHPKTYKEQLEKLFSYHETGIFKPSSMVNTVILENGYAKSTILNKDAWKTGVEGRVVKRIDIVFTKYPVNKDDWITNYHELLVDRLIELFDIDPSLNNTTIEWNLLLQTDCKKAWEAKQFFHGILIIYENIQPKIPVIQTNIIKDNKTTIGAKCRDSVAAFSIPNIPEIEDQPKFERPKRNKRSKKNKLKNLPDCPSFDRKRLFGIF